MCVRVTLSSLYGSDLLFFLVNAYVTCYSPLAPSFSIRATSHATRAPSRFLAVPSLIAGVRIVTLFSKSYISYGVKVLCVL